GCSRAGNNADCSDCFFPAANGSRNLNGLHSFKTLDVLQDSQGQAARMKQQQTLATVLVTFNCSEQLLSRFFAKARHVCYAAGCNRRLEILQRADAERAVESLEFF